MRILIVEDNRINQLLVKNMLRQFGIERFETAENGRQALRLLEEQSFDLVLMDILLPEMDGYEITRFIRSKLPKEKRNVPVIALTADASEKVKASGNDAGMDDFLVKPYTPEELHDKLQKFAALMQPAAEAELQQQLAEKRKFAGFRLEVLERFTGGDLDLTVQLIEIFLRQIPDAINRLETNIPLKNWPEVHAAAHKIKSSVSVFEMKELRRLIIKIEESARDLRKLDEIPSTFSAFKFNAQQAIAVLEIELQRLQQARVDDL
jgi:CheY-like chemotaxis protein